MEDEARKRQRDSRLDLADKLEWFAYHWNEFKGSEAQRLVLEAVSVIRALTARAKGE